MDSVEERLAVVRGNPHSGMGMAELLGEAGPLKPGSLRVLDYPGGSIGFDVQLNNISYRDVNVSTIEGLRLKVDGETIDQGNILFRIHQLSVLPAGLAKLGDVMWGATDEVWVTAYMLGGLSKGDHVVEIEIDKRRDFGHSVGDAEQGYDDADEFHETELYSGRVTYTV